MLGDSALLGGGGSSGGASDDAVAAAAAAAAAVASGGGGASHEGSTVAAAGGGGSNNSGDDERGRNIEEGGSSFGGNRWPRQETLALLRIRSDMEAAFREASVKGPLWEQVSRKMAELGYQRSSKKCKEKFENVYKYHKRTKEGRTGKSDGKTYRFFDQLEALENQSQATLVHHQSPKQPPPLPPTVMPPPPPPPPPPPQPTTTTHVTTVPSTTIIPSYQTTSPQPITNPTTLLFPHSSTTTTTTTIPISFPSIPADLLSNSTSSSTSSDESMEGRRKRKRKWKDFFHRLMTEVIEKQEDLQKRFLEAVEKRERDRMAREESWRLQEMQRINREREILAQERSIAAAKDAAVMSFLQKIAEQHNLGQALTNTISIVQPQPQPQPNAPQTPAPVQQPAPTTAQFIAPVAAQPVVPSVPPSTVPQQQQVVTSMEIVKVADNNNGEKSIGGSSSRWPKVEVEALIRLRTSLDSKYQENGPKGPLWEEISSAMKKLGYNRNAKRCKEKWENINKYFKKVKESNKKRPEDSKTCPYFHQLDALYREKNKLDMAPKPQSMVAPLMVRPEQQWPPQAMEDAENDDDDEDDEREKGTGDEEDEEDEGGGNGNGGNNYEIVGSKAATASAE